MSPSFELLRERLLAAGVRYPRVRRYIDELADHYQDLLAEEEESGKQGGTARAAALRRLGEFDDLISAMSSQNRFRAFTARAPWLFFPVAVILGLSAGYGLTTLLMLGSVRGFALQVGGHPIPPAWLPPLADGLFAFDRYLLPVILGWGLAGLALRQRLRARWPVLAMLGLAVLGAALYCRADWPVEPRPWHFRVGSLLDAESGMTSFQSYGMQALGIFLASLLPYLMLRRRLRAAIASTALAALLSGCVSSPPPADEILRELAAHRSGLKDSEVEAGTPEDRAAMDRAAAEIESHVAAGPWRPAAVGPDSIDQVSVTAPHSLSGTWKLVSPRRLSVHSGAPDSYDRVEIYLCRLDQVGNDVEGSCLPQRRRIRGSLRGDEVRLGWQFNLVSVELRGRLLTPTDFAATFAFGALGVGVTSTDIPAYGSKISPILDGGQSGDPAALLAAALAGSAPPISRDEAEKLGGVQGFMLLGTVKAPAGDEDLDWTSSMTVYDVEFAHGWQLCGFSRDSVECR